MTQRSDDADQGSALVLVLAFMMAFAVLSVALLGKAQANVTTSRVVREQENRLAAANAGVDYGVQQVRANPTLCPDVGGGTTTIPSSALTGLNGRTITVTCAATYGTSLGAGGWALFVGSDGISTQGGGTKTINGPVYNGGGWNLSGGNLSIEDGPLVAPTCPSVSGLTVDAAFGTTCPTTYTTPPPPQTLAEMQQGLGTTKPPAANAPVMSGSCKVFSPGTYTLATKPVLGTYNYFQSGVYVLENVGEWEINEDVIAGQPPAGETRVVSVPAQCAGVGDPSGTVPGVVFILAGDSRIRVQQGSIEMFSRPLNGKQGVTVYQIQGSEGGDWSSLGNTLGTTTPVISFGNGSQPVLVIHGALYAPTGFVSLQQTNTAIANAIGGVVARRVQIDVSNSAPNGLVISNGVGVGKRVVVIRAVVTPAGSEKTVQASVVLEVGNDASKTASLSSWTVINP